MHAKWALRGDTTSPRPSLHGTEAQERSLLAAYLQCDQCPDEAHRRFTALKVLATLRETLWGVVAEVSGQSALSPADAAAYTDANYLKFQAARASFEAARS